MRTILKDTIFGLTREEIIVDRKRVIKYIESGKHPTLYTNHPNSPHEIIKCGPISNSLANIANIAVGKPSDGYSGGSTVVFYDENESPQVPTDCTWAYEVMLKELKENSPRQSVHNTKENETIKSLAVKFLKQEIEKGNDPIQLRDSAGIRLADLRKFFERNPV